MYVAIPHPPDRQRPRTNSGRSHDRPIVIALLIKQGHVFLLPNPRCRPVIHSHTVPISLQMNARLKSVVIMLLDNLPTYLPIPILQAHHPPSHVAHQQHQQPPPPMLQAQHEPMAWRSRHPSAVISIAIAKPTCPWASQSMPTPAPACACNVWLACLLACVRAYFRDGSGGVVRWGMGMV